MTEERYTCKKILKRVKNKRMVSRGITLQDLHLDRCIDDPLYQKYLRVLNAFYRQESIHNQGNEVAVYGSLVRGELSLKSDIDVLIVSDTDIPEQEVTYIEEGVEVNAHRLPLSRLADLIEQQKGKGFQREIQMLQEAVILSEKKDSISALQQKITEGQYARIPALTPEEKQDYEKFLQHEQKNLQYYRERGDEINFTLRFHLALSSLLERYFRLIQKPTPQFKRISSSIEDVEFKVALLQALQAPTLETKERAFETLVNNMRVSLQQKGVEQ